MQSMAERFRPQIDDGSDWQVTGEVPGGSVPGIYIHNGHAPDDLEALHRITTELNGGIPLEVASRRAGILRVLTGGGSLGWKVVEGLAGVALTAATAYVIYRNTEAYFETRNKKRS